jgi:hypothetical protein
MRAASLTGGSSSVRSCGARGASVAASDPSDLDGRTYDTAVAALFWIIATVSWLDWIVGHLATFDTLQFLVGLVASLVLAWAGWQAYQGSTGTTNPSSPA